MKRRDFIKGGMAGVSLMALSPGVLTRSHANAFSGEHKALVCVFLAGGNDSHNMFVPTENRLYQQYLNAKGSIAITKSELIETHLTGSSTDSVAEDIYLKMHPSLAPLDSVLANGQATVVLNQGNLIQPGSRDEFENGAVPSIPRRGSHADMQYAKRRGQVDGELSSGWGARLMQALNTQANSLAPSYNIKSSANFLNGTEFQPTLVSAGGGLKELSSRKELAPPLMAEVKLMRERLFERQINLMKGEMFATDEILSPILSKPLITQETYPSSSLADDLAMVAKVIGSQANLEQEQQIFYVTHGGYDTHKNQLKSHEHLYSELATALAAFQHELNTMGVAQNVTTFTMSDFGRTLVGNGQGTGHGWAGHELIMGGSVNGGS